MITSDMSDQMVASLRSVVDYLECYVKGIPLFRAEFTKDLNRVAFGPR